MIYFDNAATGFPKSRSVLAAVSEAGRKCGNPGRSCHRPAMYAAECLYSCRETAGKFFDTSPERVILAPSATTALNMAIKGFVRGGAVMSSLEHNAVCRPLYALRNQCKTTLATFSVGETDDETVRSFCAALDSLPRGNKTAVFTHASNVYGRILPLKALTAEAQKRGVFTIVDASQTAGHIPLSLRDSGADVICLAGHKGLFGPLGTGLMLVSDRVGVLPATVLEGGTGILSLDEGMPTEYPERFEAGTLNAPAFAGLKKAIEEAEKGVGKETEVFAAVCNLLFAIEGVTLHGAPIHGNYDGFVPVILFNIDGMNCDAVMTELAREDICVRSGLHCAPMAHAALGTVHGGVRVSLSRKNTLKEAERFADAVRRISKEARRLKRKSD